MKKRVLALLMVATLAMSSLVGCGSSKEPAQTPAESGAPASEAPAGKTVKVGMVTDVGGVHDGSFNQSSWEGLQRAQEELGIEAKYLESHTDADYVPNIETFIDDDYDLIICVGYMLADATRNAAEANPPEICYH